MVTRCDDVAIPIEVIVKSWNDERFLYPDLKMKGSSSCVFKCLDSLSGNTVALKIIGFPRSGPNKLKMHLQVQREMLALQTLQHPNILSSILCSYGPIHATIAMPYFECDLKKYVEDTGALSHKVTQGLISQALQGLSYIHAHGIVHDNLRLEHLLLNNLNADTMTLVIGGLSRIHFPSYELKNNSYGPPEILGKTATTCASDIWDLGCIFAMMLKGYNPFTTRDLNSQEVNLETLFPNIDKLGLDLLKKMLHPDPCQRITASQALVHPYFQSVQHS